MKKRLLNTQEFLDYVGLGRTKGTEWAKEIGAMKRIGRRTFFDVVIIDKALDELAVDGAPNGGAASGGMKR